MEKVSIKIADWSVDTGLGECDVIVKKEWDEDDWVTFTIYLEEVGSGDIPWSGTYEEERGMGAVYYIDEALDELESTGDLVPTFEWRNTKSLRGTLYSVLASLRY